MRTDPVLHDSELHARPAAPLLKRQAAAVTPLRVLRTAMHPGVYSISFLCGLMLLAIFWLTFIEHAHALFMIAVSTVFATVFFGLPFILSRMRPNRVSPPYGLVEFARGRFDTLYGPISGLDALLQVVVVPLALCVGGVAIAFIIEFARSVH